MATKKIVLGIPFVVEYRGGREPALIDMTVMTMLSCGTAAPRRGGESEVLYV
jgi:hypothetical protein